MKSSLLPKDFESRQFVGFQRNREVPRCTLKQVLGINNDLWNSVSGLGSKFRKGVGGLSFLLR